MDVNSNERKLSGAIVTQTHRHFNSLINPSRLSFSLEHEPGCCYVTEVMGGIMLFPESRGVVQCT